MKLIGKYESNNPGEYKFLYALYALFSPTLFFCFNNLSVEYGEIFTKSIWGHLYGFLMCLSLAYLILRVKVLFDMISNSSYQ